jgi:hypothetical protein
LKAGPYGKYIEHKGTKIPYKGSDSGGGETLDSIIKRLDEKGAAAAGARVVGGFEIRVGPYGPYMFKKDAVKKQFVSVPSGVDIDTLTVAAATAIFQAGLASKARAKNFGSSNSNKAADTTTQKKFSPFKGKKKKDN